MGENLDEFVHVATYSYVDMKGRVRFEKRRFERLDPITRLRIKTFRYWDPATRTYRKPPGSDDILYRLPSVCVAVRRGLTVHWAEGEKDCDALRGAGVVATSHHQGAGHSSLAQARALTNARNVVLWMDRDEPNPEVGAFDVVRRYNHLIEAGLRPDRIRIVGSQSGKDAYDHLAQHDVGDAIGIPLMWLRQTAMKYVLGSAARIGYRHG